MRDGRRRRHQDVPLARHQPERRPHDGSFTGSPFSNGPGPATVCGDLSGLVRVGADAVYIDDCGKPHGTFSFVNEDNLQETLQSSASSG